MARFKVKIGEFEKEFITNRVSDYHRPKGETEGVDFSGSLVVIKDLPSMESSQYLFGWIVEGKFYHNPVVLQHVPDLVFSIG